jgi:hypothetical protein
MKRLGVGLLSWLAGSCVAASLSINAGELALTAHDYAGWAVCSLVFRGEQYLDAADHGRCMQSAVSFDWQGEAFNPTEGGSVLDGFLPRPSTTLLFSFVAGPSALATEVQMAFWAGGRSNHVLRKWLNAGFAGRNIVEHRISFEIPPDEWHGLAQFEILTGYMPARFTRFLTFDPSTGALASLGDGPGEQALPVIFCADDARCMGVFSPLPLTWGGYGRWRLPGVVKWNMVTRLGRPVGTYRFRVFTAVGSLPEVTASLAWLRQTQ